MTGARECETYVVLTPTTATLTARCTCGWHAYALAEADHIAQLRQACDG